MVTVYLAINNILEWILVWKTVWLIGLVVCAVSYFFDASAVDEYYRLEGLTGNANGTANYGRVAIIAALFILQFQKDKLWKILYWSSIVFFSYIIIITASRGTFGNLIFILGGYFIFKYFSGWRLIILLLLLLGFGNLILFSAEGFLSDFYLYQRLTRNDSIAGAIEDESRIQLYTIAWKNFIEHPILGVGLNQFRYYSDGKISHTDILDVLVQLGIFGGVAYVSIYIKLYNRIRKINKRLGSVVDKKIFQLILLCFISELFFGLSNPNWFTQLEMIVLSLLIVYSAKILQTKMSLTKRL
ncbi:MAG: O-antigen ligase family protein [Ferruginibacter sp.]